MATHTFRSITPFMITQRLLAAFPPDQGKLRVSTSIERLLPSRWFTGRPAARILIRPEPGFYVMRLRSGAPLIPAIIYRLCPMVIPQPTTVAGPHPDEWCRPLDRSPRYEARLDGQHVDTDRVWTARSLRCVSRDEFEYRIGPLQRWARQNPSAPERRPQSPVDLDGIPPLF
jgi:hypothetical protein